VGLRNTASGLVPERPSSASRLMDQVPGAEQPAKKPKIARRPGPQAEDADGDGDEVVSFQVEGHRGLVTAKKAMRPTEDLVVAMNGSVLNIVFGAIISHGLDLDTKKQYTKTGKFSKAQHPNSNHDTAESELSST
jgi:hypothetical protein